MLKSVLGEGEKDLLFYGICFHCKISIVDLYINRLFVCYDIHIQVELVICLLYVCHK